MTYRLLLIGTAILASAWGLTGRAHLPSASKDEPATPKGLVGDYCLNCHTGESAKGGLDLAAVADGDVAKNPVAWEKVVRRLRGRSMPPAGKERPAEVAYASVVTQLEAALDKAAAAKPNPGRTDTVRRLNRTEYQNAIRDLLALEIDAAALLPAEEAGHGFDNVTVGELSPVLLERYITAAQKVARLAVGGKRRSAESETIRVKPDITQEEHVEGLPPGTRGGVLIPFTFPRDGKYDVQVRLTRDRNELVEGLNGPHDLVVLLDKETVKTLTVRPPAGGQGHERVDEHLKVRLTAKAGRHDLGVTFLKYPSDVLETLRQPYQSHFNVHRHPRQSPAVYQVTVTGPIDDAGPGDTESRRRVFGPTPTAGTEEDARKVLSAVLRRAYRRPVTDGDVDRLMPFFRDGRKDGGFEAGVESALAAVLVSREFLFRVERDPSGVKPGDAYAIGDVELASRLSFFLWSSIPDDALLAAAEGGALHEPAELARQVRRMLGDPKAKTLVTNFASQWLYLRNLEAITPDGRLYPDFDDNLRQALRRETEQFVGEVLRDNRSVLSILKSDHTWLNERLAKHYDVPHVYGSRFRKVPVAGVSDPGHNRGGLLRHGSVLTVTSYATRTSPVLRGKWVLENLLGTPPPPPLPDVPALDDNTVNAALPVRERLAQHRSNAACATCHNLIDPVGFGLEHYDAVGRWRATEEGQPVMAKGNLPDGNAYDGVGGLEDALLKRPEIFVGTLAEKLLTYALGRGIGYDDAPAVRGILRTAKAADYRFQDLIVAVVTSPPFTMRTAR